MKRFVIILASVLLIATSAFGGDGNVDGVGGVDLKDVIMSLQISDGLTPPGTVNLSADVNGDGKIGQQEAIYGLQVVAGLRTSQTTTVWYKDADRDGYSDGTQIVSATRPGDTYYAATELIATQGDSNDSNPNIFPVGAVTEITRIQTGIQASGAQWVAAPNEISVMPDEDKKFMLGAVIPPDLATREKRTYALRDNLPTYFDWRNNNGNFVTPVKNQGGCGSCWAFAVTAALESQVLKTSGQINPDLSEQIVVSCSGAGSCNGGSTDGASEFLKNTGTSVETCYPYTATDGNCNNACANWRSNTFGIDSWNGVATTVSDIKSAIYTTGPVVTIFFVFKEFYSYKSGVYSYTSGPYAGKNGLRENSGHAVVIVGWDDAQSCFIVKNSWGTGWGDSGYFRIAYSEVNGKTEFGIWTIAYHKDMPCTYGISPFSNAVSASGGSGSISVIAGSGCSWTAASNSPNWISITSGASGNGNGTVSYSVTQNTSASSRTGTITIAGKTFTVTQAGISCAYNISPSNNSVSGTGGIGSVNVTTVSGCSWTAVSSVTWISITSGNSGAGNGTVSYSVAQNTGSSRTGILTIAGQTHTVTQSANCSVVIAPTNSSMPSSGGTGSISVNTLNGCAWTASTNAPSWITIISGSGNGNGSVNYSVSYNSGTSPRTGTISVAGQIHTVTQDGNCTYAMSQPTTISSSGGTGSLSITASGGCSWTVASSANWIIITSNPSGIGNGTVSYSVAANTGSARSGYLSIAGKAFSLITQSGLCSYSISPKNTSVSASGGSGSVSVTALNGCNWAASSNVSWITITSGSSGSGNGTVNYSVAQNTGGSRTGTVTIGGQTFTVTQSGVSNIVIFPDKNLEAVVRQAINKPSGDIFVSDLLGLTYLDGDYKGIVNLEGLQYCTNLTELRIESNQISNISALAGLTKLGSLALNRNQISNISALAGLTKLTWLFLSYNQISDIGALAGLTKLTNLQLLDNQISDIGPLIGLTALNYLYLNNNQISNISSLTGLTNLMILGLYNNKITDISPLFSNSGIGSGDTVYFYDSYYGGNPLSTASCTVYIPQLQSRGATVTHNCSSCATLSSNVQLFYSLGGNGNFSVTASSGCTWTATSNASWISIISGSSGNGNGTVSYSVASNSGASSRTGTITINGQTFTVTQGDTGDFTNSLGMIFKPIPAGTFMMGSTTSELGRYSDETQHQVTLTKSFYMQTTEVTQGQWKAVMGSNPSYFSSCGDNCPVDSVSWYNAQAFIVEMNKRGDGIYRLPTEAEWEYAARANSVTAFANGGITNPYCSPVDPNLDMIGWYCGNASGKTHPVQGKQANAWGLYDMSGNVLEWVQDWYGTYSLGAVSDPSGPSTGSYRVVRGGSWADLAQVCRSALHGTGSPDEGTNLVGFRLVREFYQFN